MAKATPHKVPVVPRAQMDLHLALIAANSSLHQLSEVRELTPEELVLRHYSELYLKAAR